MHVMIQHNDGVTWGFRLLLV